MMQGGFIGESAHIEELDPEFEGMPIVRKRIDNAKFDAVAVEFVRLWRNERDAGDAAVRSERDAGMDGLMKGKRGLIMGVANDHSIAWGIAQTLAEHGAELAFTYQGEAFGRRVTPLAEKVGAKLVLPCDVEDSATVASVFETLRQGMGLARLYRPCHRLFRQERAERSLRRHQPRQFHPHDGDLVFLLHRGLARMRRR